MDFQLNLKDAVCDQMLFALSNKIRRQILVELAAVNHPLLIEDLIEKSKDFDAAHPAIFTKTYLVYSLKILERAGLVSTQIINSTSKNTKNLSQKNEKTLKITLVISKIDILIREK